MCDHTHTGTHVRLHSHTYTYTRFEMDIETRRITFKHRLPGGSDGKVSAYNAEDPGLIPGLGRSPGEGK